jgi:electron transfer flavoprotein alpha subunit
MVMSKDIFVFVESKEGVIRKVSLELLSKGKALAGHLASRLYAVAIGYQIKDVAEALKAYADNVIVVDNELLKEYSWDSYTAVFAELIKRYAPFMVFGPSTVTGRDFFPRLAARLRSPMVSDAIDIDLNDSKVKIKKPLFGGKIFSWVECRDDSMIFVTFRPNSFSIETGDLHGAIVEEQIEVVRDPRINIVSVEKTVSKKVDLQEADFIICGGRGMNGPDNFQVLEEIAELMNGRVGASRSVVDSKWREYDDQIGKSGKTVSPKLYMGCGVSGALHHIMGMDTSKVIVAINKDPNAPIFQYADYGVVGDMFDILPVLKNELRAVKEEV